MKKIVLFSSVLMFSMAHTRAQDSLYAPAERICFNWNQPNSVWDSSSKEITIYTNYIKDGQALAKERTFYYYIGNQWVPSNKYGYQWNGFLLEKDSSQMYSGGTWVNSNRTLYFYNQNYKDTLKIYEGWTGSSWQPNGKITSIFNNQNKLIERTGFQFSGGNFVPSWKQKYQYDNNGNQIEQLFLSYNSGTQTFDSSARNLATFDNLNRTTEWINQSYMSNNWNNMSRMTYVYSGSNTEPSIQYNFSWGSNQWDSSAKVIYTYNGQNQVTQSIFYNYTSGSWVPSSKTDISYNNNGQEITVKSYSWNNNQWEIQNVDTNVYDNVNALVEEISKIWDSNTNTLVNNYRCIYTNIKIMSIKENGSVSIHKCKFANPYNGGSILCNLNEQEYYTVSLYALNGQLIEHSSFRGNMLTIKSDLKPGLYILQITSADGKTNIREKVIIE